MRHSTHSSHQCVVAHINASLHILYVSMRRGTRQCVTPYPLHSMRQATYQYGIPHTPHINASHHILHISMRHTISSTYQCVTPPTPHINASWHISMRHGTSKRVIAHDSTYQYAVRRLRVTRCCCCCSVAAATACVAADDRVTLVCTDTTGVRLLCVCTHVCTPPSLPTPDVDTSSSSSS